MIETENCEFGFKEGSAKLFTLSEAYTLKTTVSFLVGVQDMIP